MFEKLFEEVKKLKILQRSIVEELVNLGYTIVGGNLGDFDLDELDEACRLFMEGDTDEAILYLENRGIELKGWKNEG